MHFKKTAFDKNASMSTCNNGYRRKNRQAFTYLLDNEKKVSDDFP